MFYQGFIMFCELRGAYFNVLLMFYDVFRARRRRFYIVLLFPEFSGFPGGASGGSGTQIQKV